MKDLFAGILDGESLPDSWKYSTTTLIPKEEKDSKYIANYSPIALLNVDYKIFASVIAERLQKILPTIIHLDQNGFLPKRNLKKYPYNFKCPWKNKQPLSF